MGTSTRVHMFYFLIVYINVCIQSCVCFMLLINMHTSVMVKLVAFLC